MNVTDVVNRLVQLSRTHGIHNVNFVTPDHFFPYTLEIIAALRDNDISLPIVYNMSGYEQLDSLKSLESFADIYLPDFKYADSTLGERLSHCRDYPSTALDAIAEMVRQKGFLDVFFSETPEDLAHKGVLVRHLILPGQVQNSIDALSMLFLEFGKDLPLSIMSQYHPVQTCTYPGFQRRITKNEFQQVYDHALALGFHHLFVQYPEQQDTDFLPDFSQHQPFKGNVTENNASCE